MYESQMTSVIWSDHCDNNVVATCELTEIAVIAAAMLNKAYKLNRARKYTASARIHHAVRELPGFKWIEPA